MVFSSTIVPILTAAGWYPDRHVSVSHTIPPSHPAAAVLSELGGIEVAPPSAEGVECATSRLRFETLTSDVDSQMRPWSALLRIELVGIAQVEDGNEFLYLAGDGRCFGMSGIHDAFYYEGNTIEEAVERRLLGYRVQPILRPDETSVMAYGKKLVAGDPRLYEYQNRGPR
jgi:SUKH-3 immunity protein